MIVGGFFVLAAIWGIGSARSIAIFLLGRARNDAELIQWHVRVTRFSLWIAAVSFYVLDFSINAVTASCRALILDVPPLEQQSVANAWCAKMIAVGNIAGYAFGFINLVAVFPMLGKNQLQVMCSLSAMLLIAALAATCISVQEERLSTVTFNGGHWYHPILDLTKTFRNLPTPVQRICNVQFFAWIGWFPFLFYRYVASW